MNDGVVDRKFGHIESPFSKCVYITKNAYFTLITVPGLVFPN